jgi:transposase
MARHRMSDDQWECIEDLFPKPAATGRPPRNPRDMMDGIFWILRTGAPWRDLPEEFGKWSTVWDYFDRWNANGILASVLDRLKASHVDAECVDQELWCIDGTIVRAARCAAGGAKKTTPRSRRTMPWDAPAAAFPRRSISCATGTPTRCTRI